MKKKADIFLPKGKEAKNVEFKLVDGKIEVSYDVEDIFNPKDGDFVISKTGLIFIFKKEEEASCDERFAIGYIGVSTDNHKIHIGLGYSLKNARYATEQEKSAFLERLEKEYKQRWNPETKQLEDIRWRAENENIYYYVSPYMSVKQEEDIRTDFDGRLYECGNYFRTSKAAQKVADQIEEIFKNSKTE